MHVVGKGKGALDFNTEFIHILYIYIYVYIYIYPLYLMESVHLATWWLEIFILPTVNVIMLHWMDCIWISDTREVTRASQRLESPETSLGSVFHVEYCICYSSLISHKCRPVSSFCMFEFIQRFSKHSVLRNTWQPSEVIWATYCQYANSAENQWVYFNGWYILNCHWEFYVPFRYIILMPVDVVWMNSLRDLDGRLNYILMPAFISCIPIPTTEWLNKFA